MSFDARLFDSIQVGRLHLGHRVVMCPLTRYRATKKSHVPVLPLMKKYYAQRASHPGTFLISEATFIAPQAGGYDNIPGIWSQEQIRAWKEVCISAMLHCSRSYITASLLKITSDVHAKGSHIYLQLWALGRAAKPAILKEDGFQYVAPFPIPFISKPMNVPRELTVQEIQEYISLYVEAAKNALEAGFDGVEVHCANGYLIDQFLQDVSNQRNDDYGGDVDRRCRFGLEVINAVVGAIGADRTGFRLSPWGTFQGMYPLSFILNTPNLLLSTIDMGMEDPRPQFAHFVTKVKQCQPQLAYLHVVEPEVETPDISNKFLRDIWAPQPFISAGGYTTESALEKADKYGDLIAFGKHFIANVCFPLCSWTSLTVYPQPDLPLRIKYDLPFNSYDPATFCDPPGDMEGTEKGYIDYPFADRNALRAHF